MDTTIEEIATDSAAAPSQSFVAADNCEDGQPFNPASIKNIGIQKPFRSTKIGIRFKSDNGYLEVDSIAPTGLLASSPLRPGDRLTCINNVFCSDWTSQQASQFVRDLEGYVFFVAENHINSDPYLTETAVYKAHPTHKTGVSFSSDDGQLCLRYISPTGLLAGALGVAVGDLVVAINSLACSEIDSDTAVSMVRSSHQLVTFSTRRRGHESAGTQSDSHTRSHHAQSEKQQELEDTIFVEAEEGNIQYDNQETQMEDTTAETLYRASADFDRQTTEESKEKKSTYMNDIVLFNQCKRMTPSFVESLPVVDALPEVKKSFSVVATATDLVPIDQEQLAPEGAPSTSESDRPVIMNVRIFKHDASCSLGILLGSRDGNLQISSLSPEGLLASSSLRVGDRILRLNNTVCSNWTPDRAASLLRETRGFVYIVAMNTSINADQTKIETTLYKSHQKQKLGIQFDSKNRVLHLKYISPMGLMGGGGGPFGVTVDDQVESINDVLCTEVDAATAANMVNSATDKVTIVTRQSQATNVSERHITMRISDLNVVNAPEASDAFPIHDVEQPLSSDAEPRFISATVFKPSRQAPLGIRLDTQDGKLEISQVYTDGILASSPLRAGLNLFAINNKECKGWSAPNAVELLRQAEGNVTIVAQNPFGNPSYVQAMIAKQDPDEMIGITFGRSRDGLCIVAIKPNSSFANSVLNSGDYVLAINNVSCQHMGAVEAVQLVRSAPNVVSILTRTSHATGVVVSVDSLRPNRHPRNPISNDHSGGNGKDQTTRNCYIVVGLLVAALIVFFILRPANSR